MDFYVDNFSFNHHFRQGLGWGDTTAAPAVLVVQVAAAALGRRREGVKDILVASKLDGVGPFDNRPSTD